MRLDTLSSSSTLQAPTSLGDAPTLGEGNATTCGTPRAHETDRAGDDTLYANESDAFDVRLDDDGLNMNDSDTFDMLVEDDDSAGTEHSREKTPPSEHVPPSEHTRTSENSPQGKTSKTAVQGTPYASQSTTRGDETPRVGGISERTVESDGGTTEESDEGDTQTSGQFDRQKGVGRARKRAWTYRVSRRLKRLVSPEAVQVERRDTRTGAAFMISLRGEPIAGDPLVELWDRGRRATRADDGAGGDGAIYPEH